MSFFPIFCACLLFFTSTARFSERMPSYYGRYNGYGESYPYGRVQPRYGYGQRWSGGYRRNLNFGEERTHAMEGKDLESDDENRRDLFNLDPAQRLCPTGFELTFAYHNGECQQHETNEGETRALGAASEDIHACALACYDKPSCHAFDYKEGFCWLNEKCDFQDVDDGYRSCKRDPRFVPLRRPDHYESKYSGVGYYGGGKQRVRSGAFSPALYGFGMTGGRRNLEFGKELTHALEGTELESDDVKRRDLQQWYNYGYEAPMYNPYFYHPHFHAGGTHQPFYNDLNLDDWYDADFYKYGSYDYEKAYPWMFYDSSQNLP